MNNQSKGRIRGGDSTSAQQQTSSAAGDMRATAWMTPAILLTLLVVATLVYTGRTARVPAACALGAIGAYILRAFAKEVRNNEGAAATGDAGGVVLTPHADTGLATSEDWRASLPGTWRKDRAASESMDLACDAIKLNGLLRRATVLINGLELEVRDNNVLRFSVTSVIPFYKVTEWYTVDGVTVSRGNRRDMRRGGYTGTATARRGGDGVDLRVKWGDPHGGEVIDELRVSADGQKLFVTSSMRMKSGLVVPPYTAVYHRVR
ncbi:KRAB-A domain-containing 2-like [Pycnococcus provasolii]